MPYTRFWELSSGALLAYFNCFAKTKVESESSIKRANYLSIAGFVVLALGFLILKNSAHNFPGVKAILPILGSVLIIAAGPNAIFNKYILSHKVLVFLGLISYPLYLWHWPILSVCNIIEAGLPSRTIRITAVILSIVFATLTYYFIEPKLRYGKNGNKKALGLFLVMLAIGIYGITEYKYSYTYKIIPRFAKLDNVDPWPKSNNACLNKYPKWAEQDNTCQIEENPSNEISVAIMGDSHSGHLITGISNIKDRAYNLEFYSISCKVPYYKFKSAIGAVNNPGLIMRSKGDEIWDIAFEDVLNNPKIKVVVLAHYPSCSREDISDSLNPKSNMSKEVLHEIGAKRTFDLLKEYRKQVIIVKDNPLLPFDPKSCQSRPLSFHTKECSFDRSIFDKNEPRNFFNSIIEKVAKDYDNISFIDLGSFLCDKDKCYAKIDDKNLYRDVSHLSTNGSEFVAPMLDKAIKKALEK